MSRRRQAAGREAERRQRKRQATAAALAAKRERVVNDGELVEATSQPLTAGDDADVAGDDVGLREGAAGGDGDGTGAARPLPSLAGLAGRVLGGVLRRDRVPRERSDEPWSFVGIVTLVAITAVLQMPIAALGWAERDTAKGFSFAAFLVWTGVPTLIPLFLVLGVLIAMPLARGLARQPRSLRVLECLGVVACMELGLIGTWARLPQNDASYHDGSVVAAAGLADVVGLTFGAVAYPALQKLIARRAGRLPPRR